MAALVPPPRKHVVRNPHRLEMNYSQHFWEIVARHCPDHKTHRRWLRKNGLALYRDQESVSPAAVEDSAHLHASGSDDVEGEMLVDDDHPVAASGQAGILRDRP